jgi:hypothetical protein
MVLKIFCDLALEQDDRFGIMTEDAIARGEEIGLTADQIIESATILSEGYDLEPSRALAEIPPNFTVTTHGFIKCVSAVREDYEQTYNAIASAIINKQKLTNNEIAAETGAPLLLVEQTLELMADKRYLHLDKCHGREWHVSNVSPSLRRVLGGA